MRSCMGREYLDLAVGGDWPGDVSNPSGYSADLDLYSIDYWGP